jgi:hypothetical protein
LKNWTICIVGQDVFAKRKVAAEALHYILIVLLALRDTDRKPQGMGNPHV